MYDFSRENGVMKPHFIGIGFQKCATAWLFASLKEHPEIEMAVAESGNKNLFFFDHFFDHGFEWYEKHFEAFSKNSIAGEFSTSYAYSADVPKRVYNYAPDSKLIVSLRNPIDRTLSNHKHELAKNRVTGPNRKLENALKNNPLYYIQSMYHTHLANWLAYFPKEQIHIVLVEDIKEKPKQVLKGLYEFLGVNPGFIPSYTNNKVHRTVILNDSSGMRRFKSLALFLRKMGLKNLMRLVRKSGLKNRIQSSYIDENAKEKTLLNDETRQWLEAKFKPEIEALAETFELDLNHWQSRDSL